MRNQIKKLLCAGFVSGVALCTNAQTYSNAVMALHPVAYYPLNESVSPPLAPTFAVTNYGTDGAANMTPNFDVVYGFPSPLASQPNDSSDYFNGNSSYAEAAFDTNVSTVPSFTIEGWFLSRNPGGGTQCAVSDFDGASPRSGWLIYMDIANAGQYQFRAYNQNGTTPSLSLNLGGAGSILADKWYHLAVVVNASGGVTNVSGYLNGALVAGPTALNSYIPNDGLNGGFSAGIRSDTGFAFAGGVDELAYYTNALAGGDILAHYQAATNPAPVTPYDQLVLQQHPVLYYRFNESTPALVNPYPVALPVAKNAGSFGASANGFYTVDSIPAGVPGPTNSGFGGLTALELNPTGIASTTTAGPGVWCDPWNSELFNLTNAMSVTFWTEMALTPGYFSSVMGRSDQSWRFDVDPSGLPHFAAQPNGDLVGPTSVADGNWHYWAGVFDPVAQVGTLYLDGVAVASAPWSALASEVRYPLLIGGVADYVNGARNFPGNIAQVAVYTNALTAAQVNSLYAAAGGSLPHANILNTAITIDEGLSTNIVGTASGSLPLSVQWYSIDTNSPPDTNAIIGATATTLALNNVSRTNSGYQYFLVASNPYGVATSSIVTLTVIQGPPVIQTDITPLNAQLPAGVTDSFNVSVTGSQPFFYQWYVNSTAIPGATSTAYSFAVLAGANTYDVVITNTSGSVTSSVATVTGVTTPPPIITFGDGSLWSTNSNVGPGGTYGIFLGPGNLLLTDGNGGEASSAFYIIPQYIDGFVASFTYSTTNGGADGTTFLVQNDPAGTNALGGGGGELGYYGIGHSAAFELNLYTGANGGSGISYGTDGNTPDSPPPTVPPYLSPAPVAVNSGNPINVRIAFFNGVMRVKMFDTVTLATYVGSFTFGDLLPIVGSASGYVGFTGATGGVSSTQAISNFEYSYTTPPVLSLKASGGNAVVSWPVSVATLFQLQSAPSIAGPFTNVTNAPTIVSGQNQVTLPLTGSKQFFQLVLP